MIFMLVRIKGCFTHTHLHTFLIYFPYLFAHIAAPAQVLEH